jgi:hypothetical protein
MTWWGWVVVGAALLASELFVDAQFYLVFLGLAAFAVGGAGLLGLEGPAWAEWLAFAALAVVALVVFRGRVYARLRGSPPGFDRSLLGETAVATERIEPGAVGRAELRGSVWSARNAGERAVEAGSRVRVEGTEGLVLRIRPEAPPA